MDWLAGSFSVTGPSAVARGGEGAAVAGGSLPGELVVSSKIAVALHKSPGLVFINRSKGAEKQKEEITYPTFIWKSSGVPVLKDEEADKE